MMFDPPDYPYKELQDTYEPHVLFNNDIETSISTVSTTKTLVDATEDLINNVENQLSFHSNASGRHFNVGNTLFQDVNITEQNTELYLVQSENLYNCEPTLLDDNTVNQFLLPLQDSTDKDKHSDNNGPDLLALHSCAVCHEIFTTEADLFNHTISHHISSNSVDQNHNNVFPVVNTKSGDSIPNEEPKNEMDFDSEWLVCRVCERVLSTALEVEPKEQLCCIVDNEQSSVTSRKLHTMFVCDYCNGLFADNKALDRHLLTCFIEDHSINYTDATRETAFSPPYSDVSYSCDTCGIQYKSTDELRVHSIQCSGPVASRNGRRTYFNSNNNKMWNCGSCNQLFATARELYRHKRGEDRPPGSPLTAYVCEECDKVLGSMCALHTHKKMHKVSKPGYPCRVCGRRFNQSGHLAIHMRMHTGERPYPCDLCPKAFKVKVERDDHRRTHTGERPFACAACPKTFTAAARLREHARIHTDQRPYRCDICGAAFRRPYARTVHTLIHTGAKPHECDVCGTAFRRSGDMWKHKRTLHGVHANGESVLKN